MGLSSPPSAGTFVVEFGYYNNTVPVGAITYYPVVAGTIAFYVTASPDIWRMEFDAPYLIELDTGRWLRFAVTLL